MKDNKNPTVCYLLSGFLLLKHLQNRLIYDIVYNVYVCAEKGGSVVKKRIILSVLLCSLVLTGCTTMNMGGVENLLTPPDLSSEQTEIKEALMETVGKNIKLKYPRLGDYRSAFLIADIDEEESEEAIVFYERTGITDTDGRLRMAILDKKDDKWTAVYDNAGMGTDVERVRIEKLGDEKFPTVLVGYSFAGNMGKVLTAYNYSNGALTERLHESYMNLEITDLDNNGEKEISLLTADNKVKVCVIDREGIRNFETDVESGTSGDYARVTNGKLRDGRNALYVDTSYSDGMTATQIIYAQNGFVKNPVYALQTDTSANTLVKTMRPTGYYSVDVDGDGVVEIPMPVIMTGYENEDVASQLYLTEWYDFNPSNLSFEKKNTGYYSITDGYCFMMPSRWTGSVTVKRDIAKNEIVFYKYSGDITDDSVELMRISVVNKSGAEEKMNEGFIKITETVQVEYLVKISDNKSEPLVPTESEVTYNFRLV